MAEAGAFALYGLGVAVALMIASVLLARLFPVSWRSRFIFNLVAFMTFTPMFWLYGPVMHALNIG